MKLCRSLIACILFSAAACGATSLTQHRGLAQQYQVAAEAARARGDATEAARLDALSKREIGEAQAAEGLLSIDEGGAP